MLFRHLYTAFAATLFALPSRMLTTTPINQRSAPEVIDQIQLVPNDEKGSYTQDFQDPDTVANRSVSTAIYYLLEGSTEQSIWHRLDATEVWHFYAGAPLALSLSYNDGAPIIENVLGSDISSH